MSGEDSLPKAGLRSTRESLGSPLGGGTGRPSDFCLLGNGLKNYCGASRKPAQEKARSFQRLATCSGKSELSVPNGKKKKPSRLLGRVRGKLEENSCVLVCNQMTFGSNKCNERPTSSLLDWARTRAKKGSGRGEIKGAAWAADTPIDGSIGRLCVGHWESKAQLVYYGQSKDDCSSLEHLLGARYWTKCQTSGA